MVLIWGVFELYVDRKNGDGVIDTEGLIGMILGFVMSLWTVVI